MDALERRYRSALRWYPPEWRQDREDAIVGTLLDVADGEGRTRPRPGELANLATHGLRTRLAGVRDIIPSGVRDRAATAALAIGAAVSLSAVVELEVAPGRHVDFFLHEPVTFGPFASPAIVVYVAFIAAFLAAVIGHPRAARGLAIAAIPLAFAARAFADVTGMLLRPNGTFLGLLILLAFVAALGRPASRRGSVGWLLAWFVAAAGTALLLPVLLDSTWPAFREPSWLHPAIIGWSPVVALLLAALLRTYGQRSWAAAALLVGIPFTAVAATSRTYYGVAWLALLLILAAATTVLLLRMFGLRLRLDHVRRRETDDDPDQASPTTPRSGPESGTRPRHRLPIAAGAVVLALAAIGTITTVNQADYTPPELHRAQEPDDLLPAEWADVMADASTRFIATIHGYDIYLGSPATGPGYCLLAAPADAPENATAGCASGGPGTMFGVDRDLSIGVGDTTALPAPGRPLILSDSVTAFVIDS